VRRLHSYRRLFFVIVIFAAVAIYIAWPGNNGVQITPFGQRIDIQFPVREGLDLQGGMQVLLEPDVTAGTSITAESMQVARQIIERRVNALGVAEPLIQQGENNRIIVELPGIKDPDQAIQTFGQTGLLEFIDAGSTFLPDGLAVTTSLGGPSTDASQPTKAAGTTPAATAAATATVAGSAAANPTVTAQPTPVTIYKTIIQGKNVRSSDVGFDESNRPEIRFKLDDEGTKLFADYTSANVGKYLAITMDKRVLSSPTVQSPITGGDGRITGRFTLDEARSMVIQLKYGSLPVPLKIAQIRTVGPTLGQDSVQKSIVAGIIGLGLVATFMLVYYRIPGLLADLALIIYSAVVFALFKTIPVTLTVAGIAGFILSIGMAVDANILIFERMKEELRAGRSLRSAIDAGFGRAWTSIRDSNISTIITCVILFWFGMSFGASIIQGFALTLFVGVVISMFTAITVSRTLLHVVIDSGVIQDLRWYGLHDAITPPPVEQQPASQGVRRA
jgi:preprotein translocase subunit SecD